MHIVVAGAGPAGVATASALARLGHDVTVLAPPSQRHGVEGLSFRVVEGLRAAGLSQVANGLLEPVGRTSVWNGDEQSAGQEWLVERCDFDAALAAAARDFVELRTSHFVSAIERASGLTIAIRNADGSQETFDADFLVEARGRGAPGAAQRITGPRTVALCRRYSTSLPPSTFLETSPQGWAWLAVPRTGDAYVQLSTGGALPGREALAAHFEAVLEDFPAMRARLAAADAKGPIEARLASAGLAAEPVQGRVLRVGDAALAIDPLSGHGVFEAIAGAFAAAATINTILKRPEDAELARRFYNERAVTTFRARAMSGQVHYRAETRWPDAPFWKMRQSWPEDEATDAPTRSTIARRAVIDEGWIREADVVVTPEQPRGVWRLDGVPVVRLWQLQRDGRIGNAEDAAKALDVPLPAAANALAWLERSGL